MNKAKGIERLKQDERVFICLLIVASIDRYFPFLFRSSCDDVPSQLTQERIFSLACKSTKRKSSKRDAPQFHKNLILLPLSRKKAKKMLSLHVKKFLVCVIVEKEISVLLVSYNK